MADPQDPQAPPPPPNSSAWWWRYHSDTPTPWWKWVAQQVGLGPQAEGLQKAGDWIDQTLSPKVRETIFGVDPAKYQRFEAKRAADQAAARQPPPPGPPGPAADPLTSAVVTAAGQKLVEKAKALSTPDPAVTFLADQARQNIKRQTDAVRAVLPDVDVTPALRGAAGALPAGDFGEFARAATEKLPPIDPLDLGARAITETIPNFVVGATEDATTPVGSFLNTELPFKAAGPLLAQAGGAVAHLGMLPGFFSRVDKIAEAIPKKGIHPNKLASLFKAGASGEEVAYRGLPELLAQKGNQLISKEELAAHLAAHPPPQVGRTVLGEPPTPMSFEEWRRRWDEAAPGQIDEETLRRGYEQHRDTVLDAGVARPTKYESYALPGGANYRESLTTLADPIAARRAALEQERHALGELIDKRFDRSPDMSRQELDALIARHDAKQAEIDALPRPTTYQSGHFDQPNVLVHARSTERQLPLPAVLPEGYQVHQGQTGGEYYYFQRPDRSVGIENYPTAEDATRAAMAHAGQTPERGRFLEEVQSDWNQTGKRQGYQTPATPEQAARLAQLTDERAAMRPQVDAADLAQRRARQAYAAQVAAETRELLPPEYQHLASFDHALMSVGHGDRGAVEAWRTAQEAAHARSTPALQAARDAELRADGHLQHTIARMRALDAEHAELTASTTKGVPNNPFKETWPDLALKQQLLDVANRQDLSWLGFTSGKTQAARYDLSKQISKLEYDPDDRFLIAYDHEGNQVINQRAEPEELADYIGKEPADKLTAEINAHAERRAYDRAQWTTEIDPDSGRYLIIDPNGEPVYTYDGALQHFSSESEANAEIDELVRGGEDAMRASAARDRDPYLPTLSGLDLQVGGEGMTHFYDQLLPRRLEKLVKPFGGTVEQTTIPAGTKMVPGSVTKYRIVDPRGQWALPSYRDFTDELDARRAASFLEGEAAPFLTVEAYQAPGEVSMPATEPAWITHLSPEMKERLRREGFPLMSLLPPALLGGAAAAQLAGGDEDHPSGGAAGLAAALPFALPKGGGSLARALKRAGVYGEYALRAPIIERLARLYEHGATLPASSWGGPEVAERLLQGFDNDADLARRWGRLWGATSPNTSVPVNTRESVSALAHTLLHPGEPLTNEVARQLPGAKITMAGSKVPNINLALADQPLGGDKVEAMAGFMTGQPRIPIDVHALYALGAAWDKLDRELPLLRTLMTQTEGLPRSGGLTNTDLYRRTEEAIARALERIAPGRDPGETFAQMWEGTRSYKGLKEQGAPVDILGSKGLLETGALLDPERIRHALANSPGWAFKSK